VLLGLSGGVDSSVVAALLHKAIGDQLTCVFVDHGLLRLNEGDDVMRIFAKNLGVRVIRVNAADRYFAALKGVDDPEAKRKIIGKLFIDVFDEQAAELKSVEVLAQGTIYPDVIESGGRKTGKAHVIKSHHNVGGLPAHMKLKLVEPLRDLFKDEVRRIGVELGLPAEMVYRHPFPGWRSSPVRVAAGNSRSLPASRRRRSSRRFWRTLSARRWITTSPSCRSAPERRLRSPVWFEPKLRGRNRCRNTAGWAGVCLACGRGGEGWICRCGPGSVRPAGGPKGFLAVGFTGREQAMAGSGSP
jgi:hypothetical protein